MTLCLSEFVATNSESGKAKKVEEMKKLAIDSSKALGMNYSGVDIMLSKNGYTVTEVNSIPAWKGLQSVCNDKNIAEEMVGNFIRICEK